MILIDKQCIKHQIIELTSNINQVGTNINITNNKMNNFTNKTINIFQKVSNTLQSQIINRIKHINLLNHQVVLIQK